MKVAIFGAGTMGSGIAQVFAAKGHTALMYASSVASAQKHKDKLAASLAKRVAKGKMTQEAVDALLANVLVEEKSACADADLIIECVKEDMATKKALLGELDAMCKPEAIFATNTSSLSVTEMGKNDVFEGCTSLTEITVAEGNQNFFVEDGVLYGYEKDNDGNKIDDEIHDQIRCQTDHQKYLPYHRHENEIPDKYHYFQNQNLQIPDDTYNCRNCANLLRLHLRPSFHQKRQIHIGHKVFAFLYHLKHHMLLKLL